MLSRPPDNPSGATRLRDCPALQVSYLSTRDRGAGQYTVTGDARELGKRAEAGILPILTAQPRFKSYAVAIGEGQSLLVQRLG